MDRCRSDFPRKERDLAEAKKCRIWSYSGSGVKSGLAFSIKFHAARGLKRDKGVGSGESQLAASFTHKFATSKIFHISSEYLTISLSLYTLSDHRC